VIAIIAILAAMLLPALSRARIKAKGIYCLNNLKQLDVAWMMYADDYQGIVPPNNQLPTFTDRGWVDGILSLTPNNKDNTNSAKLTTSLLGPYAKNQGIYRCSADSTTATEGGVPHPRVRSVSMNSYIVGSGKDSFNNPDYCTYKKLTDMVRPAPVNLLVILDENEQIDDGFFGTYVGSSILVDCPASYHGGSGGLTFADGHAEIHKWRDPNTLNKPYSAGRDSPRDMAWFTEHMTAKKN
jgi:prepilin-type processing-associated H-X9-DG protein